MSRCEACYHSPAHLCLTGALKRPDEAALAELCGDVIENRSCSIASPLFLRNATVLPLIPE